MGRGIPQLWNCATEGPIYSSPAAANLLNYCVPHYGENQVLASSYDGNVYCLLAADTTPPATITSLATGSPTTTSITLTWTAPAANCMAGNATSYVAKYSTSGPRTASNWATSATYAQSMDPSCRQHHGD